MQHRFTFGPIEFTGLDGEIDGDTQRQIVIGHLEKVNPALAKICNNFGYRICVKGRTLKRATSLLKHARFLQNLEVTPVWPPEPKLVQDVNEDEGANEDQD